MTELGPHPRRLYLSLSVSYPPWCLHVTLLCLRLMVAVTQTLIARWPRKKLTLKNSGVMTCWICVFCGIFTFLCIPVQFQPISQHGELAPSLQWAGRGCCRYQLPLGGALVMKAGHVHLSPLAELSLCGGNKTTTYDTSETTPLLILTIAGRNSFHTLVHAVLR